MTDLTEQWKKGELPGGVYYVIYYKNDTPEVDIYRQIFSLHNKPIKKFTINQVTKVLAPVPSYEEWQAAYEYEKYADNEIKNLKAQNAQLKELLKEWVQFETEENPNDFTVMSERMSELSNKTKKVLQ